MDWSNIIQIVLLGMSALMGVLFIVSWATSGIDSGLRDIASEMRKAREQQASQYADLQRLRAKSEADIRAMEAKRPRASIMGDVEQAAEGAVQSDHYLDNLGRFANDPSRTLFPKRQP